MDVIISRYVYFFIATHRFQSVHETFDIVSAGPAAATGSPALSPVISSTVDISAIG